MSPHLYDSFLKETAFSQVVPASDILENLRIVKSDWELQCIREASRIAKKGIEAAALFAGPGKLDLEIVSEIERVCRTEGSEFFPHQTMVSSGPDEGSWGLGHGVGLEVNEWPFIGYHTIAHDHAY